MEARITKMVQPICLDSAIQKPRAPYKCTYCGRRKKNHFCMHAKEEDLSDVGGIDGDQRYFASFYPTKPKQKRETKIFWNPCDNSHENLSFFSSGWFDVAADAVEKLIEEIDKSHAISAPTALAVRNTLSGQIDYLKFAKTLVETELSSSKTNPPQLSEENFWDPSMDLVAFARSLSGGEIYEESDGYDAKM